MCAGVKTFLHDITIGRLSGCGCCNFNAGEKEERSRSHITMLWYVIISNFNTIAYLLMIPVLVLNFLLIG